MNACEEHNVDLLRYLDNELSGKRLNQFLAHLQTCTDCKTTLEEYLALSTLLRRSRPLFSASTELRTRVMATLANSESASATSHFGERAVQWLAGNFRDATRMIPELQITGLTVAVATLCFLLVSTVIRSARASDYVETAVVMHRSYLTGHLPLEIQSGSPQVVAEWLTSKGSFPFLLPASQEETGSRPDYKLVGARLLTYKKRQAALVTYEGAGKDIISLLVAPANLAIVAGGNEIRAGKVMFHYRNKSGLQIITWNSRGLSYALVSRSADSMRSSCLVCHQDMADRNSYVPKP